MMALRHEYNAGGKYTSKCILLPITGLCALRVVEHHLCVCARRLKSLAVFGVYFSHACRMCNIWLAGMSNEPDANCFGPYRKRVVMPRSWYCPCETRPKSAKVRHITPYGCEDNGQL